MANVTFRKGLEENLPTDGMAEEGCVYHATDSGNAYIGSSNGSLIPLNRSPYYGTSSTGSSTNSKVVTLDTDVFSLYQGVMITVKFANANTASSPTLNVNSTGATAVKLYGTTAAGNTPAKSWNAGEAVTFVYDGSYWLLVGGAEENVIETVKVSGTALQVTNKAVNIETETAYNPSTNKIATMSDVAGATPNVGHLKTDNTTALTPSASESFTGDISLHKVSKTGSYNDLNDKPTIPSSGDFVTALGTSGNNVTWTKNGVTNNLTVPFATVASKLGTSTVGASNRPIYLNAGVPAVTDPGEAFLSWGGRNFSASYGCIDAAMVSELGACRTMFAYAAGIVIEYSVDSGATWLDYGATDVEKVGLFSSGRGFTIGKATKETASAANMLRVTLHTSAAHIYTSLNKFVIYVSTNGSTGTYCTIRCRTQQNYEDNIDTWKILANQVSVDGWSGYNVINFPSTTTYGNTKSTQYGEWQFIFGCTGHNSASYAGMNVSKIFGFGGVGWSTPSTIASTGHLYSFDASQNAYFPSAIRATKIIKAGGTSSQFLKADGSVDSNTYATTSQLPSLPLSIANGGTGQTTGVNAANALIGALPQWTADPSDDVYLIRRDTGGSLAFGQVKFSTVWNYIKSKIASVLGIGGSNGVPTAPTAAAGTNTTQVATTAFVQSATSGMAIDTNVVHKTGNETIAGVKTFTNNVKTQDADIIFETKDGDKHTVGISLDSQPFEQEGYSAGALRFSDISVDGIPVLLKNILNPIETQDAATKGYVDSEIENIKGEKVRVQGWTGQYGMSPYSLVAFAKTNEGMVLTSFTTTGGTGQKTPVTSYKFPIGSKIYFYNFEDSAATAGTLWEIYTQFRKIDARYSAITGENVSLGTSTSLPAYYYTTSVFLRVSIDGEYWKPYYKDGSTTEIIVSIDQLVSGNYYIYLGRTTAEMDDVNHRYFQLEDNNPLYYYDGTNLVDWATRLKAIIEWQSTQDMTAKADKVEEATNGNLAGLDYSGNLTDSGLAADEVATLGTNQLTNYYKKTEIYSKSETDALVRAASDFEYEEVSTLPTASANTKGKFYLYNGHRYVTTEKAGGSFSWVDLGSYDIDLSGYVTNSTFEEAMRVRPEHQEVTEAQLRSMLDNETWEENVIYYTVEEE